MEIPPCLFLRELNFRNSMLKRLTAILVSLLLPLLMGAQQLDSTRLAPLDSLLEEYYASMTFEPLDVKYSECDFLISSCRDSLVRQWVATRILEHYMRDPMLMGEEAVALYVYDNWFAPGTIKIEDEVIDFEARMFAEFNRNSMIGMQAPVVAMYSPEEDSVVMPQAGRVNVLYFFDTSCAVCKQITPVLPYIFGDISIPISLYMVYTGADAQEWAEFRSCFSVPSEYVTVVHVSDPDFESDYQRLYGVVGTPKIYVVGTDGTIEGRRLDLDSLAAIINIYQDLSTDVQAN